MLRRPALGVASLLFASLLIGRPLTAAPDDIRFATDLSPDEESIPTYSSASGHAEFILNRETLKLTWVITYKDLSGPAVTAGLYGPENVGGTSGILIDFRSSPSGTLASPIRGSAVLTDGQLQYLVTGRVYANIHTAKWKDGELRGQLQRQ